GSGFTCRFCGTADGGWWQMADGLRRCRECRSESSVTAGTIFGGTRTPLVSWFAAVWYVVNQKQGVSALGLQRALGLGGYQAARSVPTVGRATSTSAVTGSPTSSPTCRPPAIQRTSRCRTSTSSPRW